MDFEANPLRFWKNFLIRIF